MLLVMLTWKNTLISNSAVFTQNQALSWGTCTFKYNYNLRKVRFNLSLNPELVHGYLLLVIFTSKNTLISHSAVFPQNHAVSGGICTFKYTYTMKKVCFSFSLNSELVHGYLLLLIFT